jgi:hypothetical protein
MAFRMKMEANKMKGKEGQQREGARSLAGGARLPSNEWKDSAQSPPA